MLLIDSLKSAQNIILSTHKSSDGDGLGSEIAMYYTLKKLGKSVLFVHSDLIPARYHFLLEKIPAEAFCDVKDLKPEQIDLALIFDTHDPKLCSPLYETMSAHNIPVFFIDHHVKTDYLTENSYTWIDETASCTGEIVYDLIRKMNSPLDKDIASSLYASLIFDTQNFKLLRHPSRPFLMASELLMLGIDYERIQGNLFANWNQQKMNLLSHLIPNVEYKLDGKIALIKILKKDLKHFQVEVDQVSDLVDLFMQMNSLEMAIVIREESESYHKLSFRSRHSDSALQWARLFNGGGHTTSAGAWVEETMPQIEERLRRLIEDLDYKKTGSN